MELGQKHEHEEAKHRAILRSIAVQLNSIGSTLYEVGMDDADSAALEMYQDAFSTLVTAIPQNDEQHGSMACMGQANIDAEEVIHRGEGKILVGHEKIAAFSADREKDVSTEEEEQVHDLCEMEFSEGDGDGEDHQESESKSHRVTRVLTQSMRFACPPENEDDGRCIVTDRYNLACVVYNMGLVYYRRQSYHTAEQLFEMCLETVPDERAESGLVTYSALNNLGHIAYMLDKHEHAMRRFSDALQLSQEAVRNASEEDAVVVRTDFSLVLTNHALTLFCVGEACEGRGMLDEAMMVYVKIVKARREASQENILIKSTYSSLVYSLVLYRMGSIHYVKGDRDKTVQAFTFALNLRKEALGGVHEDVASLVHDIGIVQLEIGKVDEAMKSFEHCLSLRRSLNGEEHKDVAEILYRIGRVHQDRGEYDLALVTYMEALRVEKVALGVDHPDVAITLTNIGQIHYLQGDLTQALEVYKEVLRMVRKSLGESHPSIAEILNTIGTIHLNRGNNFEAVTAFTEARRVERLSASESGSEPRRDTVEGSCDLGIHEIANSPGAAAA